MSSAVAQTVSHVLRTCKDTALSSFKLNARYEAIEFTKSKKERKLHQTFLFIFLNLILLSVSLGFFACETIRIVSGKQNSGLIYCE